MNNEERDNMLIEIHGTLQVMASNVESHGDTLYGNGQPGLVTTVTLLKERQESCPARKANSIEAKRLSLGHIMTIIAILSLLASIAFGIFK